MSYRRIYWAFIGFLLLAAGGSSRAVPGLEAAQGSSVGDCSKFLEEHILCPNEETFFIWNVNLGSSTSGAGVVALTENSMIEVVSTSQGAVWPTGIQNRSDVKEKIRGWCRVFSSLAEAADAASRVSALFTQRRLLVLTHKDYRAVIHDLEQKIDDARAKYFQELTDEATELDQLEDEIGVTDTSQYGLIPRFRDGARKRDASRLDKLKALIDRLRGKIDGWEGSDDLVLKKIEDVDAQVNVILGQPEECVIAEISRVFFEPLNRGLDGNPNLGGGQRYFPDSDAYDQGPQLQVQVRAVANPRIPGMKVHLRAFDRDDPGTNFAPLDKNGPQGTDNGEETAWGFNGGARTTDEVTDGNGEVKVPFTVGRYAGDNYDVAADCDEALVDSFDDDSASRNQIPLRISPGMLTVWRRLWVENDSMGPLVQNPAPGAEPAVYVLRGEVRTAVRSPGSSQATLFILPDSDDLEVLDEPDNRFEKGIVTLDGRNLTILESRVGEGVIEVDVEFGKSGALPSGGERAAVYDDDFNGTADAGRVPKLTDVGPSKKIFADAYIEVRDELPGGDPNIRTHETNITPIVNILSRNDGLNFINQHFQSNGVRSKDFWIVYIITGFQFEYDEDGDPDSEYETARVNGQTTFPEGNVIGHLFATILWIEQYEGARLRKLPDLAISKASAHEFGHQFGVLHTGGIMRDFGQDASGESIIIHGGALDTAHDSPLIRDDLYWIRNFDDSPGQRREKN